MAVSTPSDRIWISVEEFDERVNSPEFADRVVELIAGELLEKMPSNAYASWVAGQIFFFIRLYLMTHNIGRLTVPDGGYQVGGERYAPDVAFISYERQPELAREGYNPNPPELAVEVISAGSAAEHRTLRLKVVAYLRVGTEVWVVDPTLQVVEVYRPGDAIKEFGIEDTLTTPMLPEFKLPVKQIFIEDTGENDE